MPTPLEQSKNTGLILEFKETDFRAGGESSIVYEARNPSGDWEQYKPSDEWQRRNVNGILGYDTKSCVTFSAVRIVCMQIEYMLEHGLIPKETEYKMRSLGYFDADGKINFSEWFSANTNGTTYESGNTLQAVWDGIDRDGLLPAGDGYAVNDFQDQDGWFDKSKITPEMRAKAKEFRTMFKVPYEWAILNANGGVQDQYAYHLKHAPIHVATPTCSTWNTRGIVGTCDPYRGLNHATSCIGLVPNEYIKDLDHYNPFVKKLAWDYYMPYGIKAIVKLVEAPVKPKPMTYMFTKNLAYGMGATTEVHKLQEVLQTLGYMRVGLFGIYGPITRGAVAAFQKDHGIVDDGTHFGPKTRSAMNMEIVKALSTPSSENGGGDGIIEKGQPADKTMPNSPKYTLDLTDLWKTFRGSLITLAAVALAPVVAYIASHYMAWSYVVCLPNVPCFDSAVLAIPAIGALIELARRWIAGHPVE